MTSLRTKMIIIFLMAVAARLAFHLWTGFVADDAFITFRYAENMAYGNGFVYNIGERVLGTSTPLYTWLLAFLASLRFSVIWGSLVVSLICSGLTAALLLRFATYLRFGSLAWLPAIAYTFWPRSIPADSSGMETALFTLLITATFYFFYRKLHYYAIGCATLAVLTRPEGVLLLAVILIGAWHRNRAAWRSYLATAGLLLVPWLAFAYLYFGSVIPNSIPAKLALYSQFGTMTWWQNFSYVMGWHSPAGWALVLAAISGGWWLYRKQNFGRIEIIWLMVMVLFFTFSHTHLFFWYPAPIYPVLLLLGTAVVPLMLDSLPWLAQRRKLIASVLPVLMAVALLFGLYRPVNHYTAEQEYAEKVLISVGNYLAMNVNRDTEIVAAEDIGYIGYYSGSRILDRDGLCSPVTVAYNSEGDYLALILNEQPEWVGAKIGSPISEFTQTIPFIEQYQLDTSFVLPPERGYAIYHRK